MTNATLNHFVIKREHEGEAFYVENRLDEFEYGDGFFREAAIQVVYEDHEIDVELVVLTLLALRKSLLVIFLRRRPRDCF